MEKVEDGIVFSYDIYRILKGINALDFDYQKNGLSIPTEDEIEKLRNDFEKDVKRMFNENVTIFSEEKMEDFLYDSLTDVLEYPHRNFG